MRKFLLALMLLATPAAAAPCGLDMLAYAPQDNLEKIDAKMLAQANKTIDFAAYAFTDPVVVSALTAAAERGVKIRLYRDPSEARVPKGLVPAYTRLTTNPNVTVKFKAPGPLMHLKAYVVDGQFLRDGAGNFSPTGLIKQDNSLIVLRCPEAVARFENAFNAMWSR